MITKRSILRFGHRCLGLPNSPKPALFTLALLASVFLFPSVAWPAIVTFDDVPLNENYGGPGGGNYYNGSSASQGVGDWDGSFQSGGAGFANTFSESDFGGAIFTTWRGFAVSNTVDSQSAGFGNQYSAFPGGPPPGTADSNYAIGFGPAVMSFAAPVSVGTAWITNTTYAALSMRFGDSFASAFGDDPSTPSVVEIDFPSWLLLTVYGVLDGDIAEETVELYLADYRFTDESLDFITGDWIPLDLAPLGAVDSLRFEITSSDTGPFGINTPAYFALDQLTYTPASVPEPNALPAILVLTIFVNLFHRRRS